jgi:hypothetical protein
VIVIDGILADPQAMIDRAAREARFTDAGSGGGYPGVRSPAPLAYASTVLAAVEPLIRRAFALESHGRGRADASFSIVTTPPEALHPFQRVPHVDTCSPLRVALLHFLCGEQFGGTAFFHHEATGLEQIAPADFDRYKDARRRELASLPPPRGYPNSGTPGFRRTAAFPARLDRLLIYRSFSLHSGIIPPGMPLLAVPKAGRLTLNTFVDYVAPHGVT